MLNARELWAEVEGVVAEEGVKLFDIDMPSRHSGTLRVYIAAPAAEGTGVTIDLCERVSKRISAHPRLSWILDRYALEVSSPGVNRRLQRPEHFSGAVGERVKLVVSQGSAQRTVIGTLTACDAEQVELLVESSQEREKFALDDIQKARVDFLFE